MKITVIGCGRWGTFHAWHASKIGHEVTLYGRETSANYKKLSETGENDFLKLPSTVRLTTDIFSAINSAEVILISVGAQNLRGLLQEIISLPEIDFAEKKFVLAMKGLERGTGKRLTTVFNEVINKIPATDTTSIKRDGITNEKLSSVFVSGNILPSFEKEFSPLKDDTKFPEQIFSTVQKISTKKINVAVWVGPGHVQDFVKDIPNCMVMASADENFTRELVEIFKSPLIRFYYGADLIGIEIGAAAKNVVGIAAGMLDGLNFTSLKGALMARGTAELSRLISALGGDKMTVYGLSHLGDYQATLFSDYSNNRRFGESFVTGKNFDKLAEGVETVAALMELSKITGVELPISRAVYKILYENKNPKDQLTELFLRSTKAE